MDRQPAVRRLAAYQQLRQQCDRCRAPKDSNYAVILLRLGWQYGLLKRYDRAGQLMAEVVQIALKQPRAVKPDVLPTAYFYWGYYVESEGKKEEALATYQACVEAEKRLLTTGSLTAKALKSQAYILYVIGDYQKAIEKAEAGYSAAGRLNDALTMSQCLNELACSSISIGKLVQAEQAIRNAIRLTTALPEAIEQLTAYKTILGNVLIDQQRNAEGIRLLKEVIAHYEKTNDFDKAADVYNTLGYLYRENLNDYAKALYYFDKAYVAFRSSHKKARALDNIGWVYYIQGQYPKALTYYQRALTLLTDFTKTNPADNPDPSVIRLTADREYLLTLIQDKAQAWLDYAKATNNRQRLRYALDTYQTADQMIDYMRWDQTAQASKLYWRQQTRGIYERAIETCYRLGNAGQAFRFFEKSRAVMLADKLNELGARQQLREDQARKEKELRQAVSDGQSDLTALTPDSARYESVRETVNRKQQAFERFVRQLEKTNPAYFRYKYDTTTAKLADLQRYLSERQATYVSYFVGDSAVYVLGLEGSRTELLRLQQPVQTYKRDVQAFINRLSSPDAISSQADLANLLALSNSIYRQTLAPLGLPPGRVIVSPDRFFVPFEALSYSAGKPDYLIQQYAFDYVYSARRLLRAKNQLTRIIRFDDDGFLGVAPVQFAAQLGQVALPGSDKALQAVAQRYRSPKLFTHAAATRQAFLDKVANARIVQLFTHAVADSTDREPLLYFADNTLRLSDLDNGEPLKAELVVLGACQTGVGADQAGEGVFSLARGFAALGVPSIVSTLWSVQDEATYTLTESFHQYLEDGLPKDVALQRAKQDWLKNHDSARDQSPNVWAGMILIGDAQPLRTPSRWPWVFVAILLGAGGAGLWWWRRKRRAIPAASFPHPA